MVKYLNKGDYVKINYRGLKGDLDLGKIKRIELTNAAGHKCGLVVPSVAFYTEEDTFQSPFAFEYYTDRGRTREAISSEAILLTEEEEKDLGIYFSGDYDKYSLIINNPFLKEAVRERLKHNTKPDPNGTFL